jgi:L-ribulose-5-phosphate 3-epimerase
MHPRLGACSWSLKCESPVDLARALGEVGVSCVQLALEPLRSGAWPIEETTTSLRRANIKIASGMIGTKGEDYSTLQSIRETGGVRSDAHWLWNLTMAEESAAIAKKIGVKLVTFHAGFLPERKGDSLRRKMLGRIAQIADRFAAQGVKLGLETGQETADTLLEVLKELAHPNVGVNFDPANMILYDMGDPVAALDTLAPHVVQVHIKDALLTENPGTWGSEVVVGTGDVDWPGFFDVVREHGLACNFMIEREAGESRVADMIAARTLVGPLIEQLK